MTDTRWHFDNRYARLPATFFARVGPTPVRAPRVAMFNRALAESLGLDADALADDAALFAGNALPPGSEPIAQAYCGHQFGHFAMLGDGRAVLLGEHVTPQGDRVDIQLKGAGPTPFSRRGDGRAALGPMLREFLVSEAMHALGIPTTRSLAVALTGEAVYRETALPGAVLTRVASSHLRVGTFEYAAARGNTDDLRALADHAIARHYPSLADSDAPCFALLEAVIDRQAALVARWMHAGFVHGVMNTDNMTLSGETIDYGPCAFLDHYDPLAVFSSIDTGGRYAFASQPDIARWNLARLAESLLPLIDADETRAVERATAAIDGFAARFNAHWLDGMRGRLGLYNAEADDADLAGILLDCLERTQADHANAFRDLAAHAVPGTSPATDGRGTAALVADADFRAWLDRWRARLARQPQSVAEAIARMNAHNPARIPRNHRIEQAIAAASGGDFSLARRMHTALATPCMDDAAYADLGAPPAPSERVCQTFCGT